MERKLENAIVGENTIVEPNVTIGFRYHQNAGPTRVGKNGILRVGTLIYGDVSIGDYFQTGHYAVIRAKVRIGNYCTLLNQSVLEGIVRMGDGVRIMTHCYIPSRTWIGNYVFIGPGVTFLNDRYPLRTEDIVPPRGATVEDHVVIGGGCTIMAGVRIGYRSFIAAGALVNKDVPPRSFVKGVPGRISPLPPHLDRENLRDITIQPLDIWHPLTPSESLPDWPSDWPERFEDFEDLQRG